MRYWQAFASVCVLGLQLVSSAAAQTRVACVGDSITEGYGLAAPANDAYPAQLQVALGSDYDVRNFGVSGTTARKQGDKPYWNQAAYAQSTTFDPSVVLIMLGTNDAKPQNWDATAFRTDYTALVAQYRALGARVLIATPPRVFGAGAFDISPSTVADVLAPLIRELAPQVDAELVDIFVVTQEHSEWFPDTVHPNRDGANALASAFAAAVQSGSQTESTSSAPTTSTGSTSPSDEPPTSSGAMQPASSPLDSEGDSIETVSPTSATSGETSQAPHAPTTTLAPTTSPTPALPLTPPAATPPSTAPAAAPTSTGPTSTAPSENATPTRASDSGCSLTGVRRGPRLTDSAAFVGLALAVWSLRRKRSELNQRA